MANTKDDWIRVKARDLKPGMTVIRQVEPRMEWVPGPYGAFLVEKVRPQQDEFVITSIESWGGPKKVRFSYDGDEEVTIVNPDRAKV